MEVITIKLDEGLLKAIDTRLAKYKYSTRTEFIREVLRDKIRDIEKEEALMRLNRLYGTSNRRTTDRQLHKAGKKAIKELEKELGIK